MADQEKKRRKVSDYLVLTQEYSDEPSTKDWHICEDRQALNDLLSKVEEDHIVAIYRGTKLEFRVETAVKIGSGRKKKGGES
jgi:hypothetical protein